MIDVLVYLAAGWMACGIGVVLWKGEDDFSEWKTVLMAGPVGLGFCIYFALRGDTKS